MGCFQSQLSSLRCRIQVSPRLFADPCSPSPSGILSHGSESRMVDRGTAKRDKSGVMVMVQTCVSPIKSRCRFRMNQLYSDHLPSSHRTPASLDDFCCTPWALFPAREFYQVSGLWSPWAVSVQLAEGWLFGTSYSMNRNASLSINMTHPVCHVLSAP